MRSAGKPRCFPASWRQQTRLGIALQGEEGSRFINEFRKWKTEAYARKRRRAFLPADRDALRPLVLHSHVDPHRISVCLDPKCSRQKCAFPRLGKDARASLRDADPHVAVLSRDVGDAVRCFQFRLSHRFASVERTLMICQVYIDFG